MKLGKGTESPGRLRRALQRFATDDDILQAEALQSACASVGATAVAECPLRTPVSVAGTIRAVTLRPRGGAPALEAELYDGSASLSLVWLGRRRIAGITPGRSVVANGRITVIDDRRVMFNPQYELRLTAAAAGRAS